MEKIKKMIEVIGSKGNREDMKELGEMLAELIYGLKEAHHKEYEECKEELYVMAYGKIITEEKAKHIIEDMKPYHQKWTIEQTDELIMKYGLSLDRVNFYIVMNSAYNDYHKMFGDDLEKYVEYSKLWLEDEDSVDYKTYEYFMNIPKK